MGYLDSITEYAFCVVSEQEAISYGVNGTMSMWKIDDAQGTVGKTTTWYNSSAVSQMNLLGAPYNWIALG